MMANTKKKRRSRSIMSRSDIPFAKRLQMQQRHDIVANRGYAAKISLYCTSVALHEIEGVGYKRLIRFSFRYRELEDEFYEDPEVGMAHAKQRMAQLGMPISGEFFTMPDEGQTRRQYEVDTHALQACQVSQIVAAIAMNDEFGYGLERQTRIRNRTAELAARYREEGSGFLLEAMAKIGFVIKDGIAMMYMDEDGVAVRPTKKEKEVYT